MIFAFQVVAGVLLLVNRYVPLAVAVLAPVIVNILSFHALMAPGGRFRWLSWSPVMWAVIFIDVRTSLYRSCSSQRVWSDRVKDRASFVTEESLRQRPELSNLRIDLRNTAMTKRSNDSRLQEMTGRSEVARRSAQALVGAGFHLRGLTREPDRQRAAALARQGVDIVKGDLDDEATLRRALAGAWGVFSVQNTLEAGVEREEAQGKRLATLAREAGVEHFVYTSVGSAQKRTGIPHFDNKWRIEEEPCVASTSSRM